MIKKSMTNMIGISLILMNVGTSWKTTSSEPFQYEIRLIGTDGEQSLSYSNCRGEIETIEYDLDPGKYYIRVYSDNYGEYEFSYSLNSNFTDN